MIWSFRASAFETAAALDTELGIDIASQTKFARIN